MLDHETQVSWKLFNSIDGRQYRGTTKSELVSKLKSISQDEYKIWQILTENDKNWRPLATKEGTKSSKVSAEGEMKVMDSRSYLESLSSDTAVTKTKLPDKDLRKAPRLKKAFQVYIEFSDRMVVANTLEISVRAIKLDQKFSTAAKEKFLFVIIKSETGVALRCQPKISEKECVRGQWNVLQIDENFNSDKLIEFLNKNVNK
jgi:hypothetical protein